MSKRTFNVVVAATQKGGIGLNGSLPWKLPGDMKYFKNITSSKCEEDKNKMNAVILGRKTWESIPAKFRPLPGRLNIILSRSPEVLRSSLDANEHVQVVDSLDAALGYLDGPSVSARVNEVFIIGGGGVYKQALNSPNCKHVYLTNVLKDFECDTFIPVIDQHVYELNHVGDVIVENDTPYQFSTYTRKPTAVTVAEREEAVAVAAGLSPSSSYVSAGDKVHEEYQYLDMIADIIATGNRKGDRTGVGTISKFGRQMRFSLRDGQFPLLTTKRVFWRGVVEELLWLIKGCTDSKELSRKRVKIWDGNGSREFLDKLGHTEREEGDLGPVYGHQWRHFGAKYVDCHTDYQNQGIDQLKYVIDKLKNNPTDRRIIMSAWNPLDLAEMALPPCHVLCQFYVNDGELSCMMYQRSCDLGLGVPFNIASYSLLTCMLAQVCGLKCGDFVHTLGDAHVYSNHVEPLKEQLKRQPKPFPILKINSEKMDIDSFVYEDFTIENYHPHKTIKMEMAV